MFTLLAYTLMVGLNGRLSRYFNIDVGYFHDNIFQLTLAATVVSLIGTVLVYAKVITFICFAFGWEEFLG